MQIKKACAFAGHRPSIYSFGYDEEHPDCLKMKVMMTAQIGDLIGKGIKTFLSGMALGADMWGAELVLRFKKEDPDVRLIAVIPCESQANKWSVEHRDRYFNILAECDEVVYISEHYTEDCMFKRNRWLIDHASHMIAVYNGAAKGGTAYTVRYACSKHLTVITIDPNQLTMHRSAVRRSDHVRLLPQIKKEKCGSI